MPLVKVLGKAVSKFLYSQSLTNVGDNVYFVNGEAKSGSDSESTEWWSIVNDVGGEGKEYGGDECNINILNKGKSYFAVIILYPSTSDGGYLKDVIGRIAPFLAAFEIEGDYKSFLRSVNLDRVFALMCDAISNQTKKDVFISDTIKYKYQRVISKL